MVGIGLANVTSPPNGVPWSTIYERCARRIGGRVGTIGGVTATSAVLNGLINTTLDDTYYAADRLFFLASPSDSRETSIQQWLDSTGTATWSTSQNPVTLLHPPTTGNNYILVNREDYSLAEFDAARDEAVRESRPTYRQVIPITPNLSLYPLSMCPWLRGGADVDAVWLSQSPVMIHNEDFSLWQNGPAAAPDGWTLSGAGASVAQVTGGIRSAYACQVTAGAGAPALLTQTIPYSLTQWLAQRTAAVFTPMRANSWIECAAGNIARVGIQSGPATTTYSAYDAGTSVPNFDYVSLTPTPAMTQFTIVLYIAAGQTATFHTACLMQNTTDSPNAFAIRDQGSQAYYEEPIQNAVRNIGGIPTVDLGVPKYVNWQLIVYTRHPNPTVNAYTDVVNPQYARFMEFGLLAWMLRVVKPQQDRSRLDRIMQDCQQEWARWLDNTEDLPVPQIPVQIVVTGV